MNTGMAEGRKDREKLIDPGEAAKAIFSMDENYDTLKIQSISQLFLQTMRTMNLVGGKIPGSIR